MKELTAEVAYEYLIEASRLNPGPWVEHSKYVAQAAANIAKKLETINSEKAKAFGYIHDIGRRFGKSKMKHVMDGYHFMMKEGYPDAARICLTHSFPISSIKDFPGEVDCSEEDVMFIENFLKLNEFNLYDKLMQLCDTLALPSGFTMVERRLVDVALRYGVDENTLGRWRSFLEIQKDIESKIGSSIYSLLPGIDETISARVSDFLTHTVY